MTRLAIDGGRPLRTAAFPVYQTMGREERQAVNAVLDSGVLSQFLGTWSPDFHGGPRVRRLEQEWAEYFGVRHAISVNSATSGLYAAIGAIGLRPGDEVIVSPYTMSAYGETITSSHHTRLARRRPASCSTMRCRCLPTSIR